MEFAYVMRSFGVDVTIVEFFDRMVPTEDAEVSRELLRHYKKLGVKVLLGTAVKGVDDTGSSGVRGTIAPAAGGDEQILEADRFLAAFGFAPRLADYGVRIENGAIAIDEHCRTDVAGLYAIGDVTGKLVLAHTAEGIGVVAAETIAGGETVPVDYDYIPRATYCQPQIASFGHTEQPARAKGYDVKVGKLPFAANAKAAGLGEAVGFVKVVAEATSNQMLGAHTIGPHVT